MNPFDRLVQIGDGEPCPHPGCRSHRTHPCEVCGRIGAKGSAVVVAGRRPRAGRVVFVEGDAARARQYAEWFSRRGWEVHVYADIAKAGEGLADAYVVNAANVWPASARFLDFCKSVAGLAKARPKARFAVYGGGVQGVLDAVERLSGVRPACAGLGTFQDVERALAVRNP